MGDTAIRTRPTTGEQLRAQCARRGIAFEAVVWRDVQAYRLNGLKYSVREACDLLLTES